MKAVFCATAIFFYCYFWWKHMFNMEFNLHSQFFFFTLSITAELLHWRSYQCLNNNIHSPLPRQHKLAINTWITFWPKRWKFWLPIKNKTSNPTHTRKNPSPIPISKNSLNSQFRCLQSGQRKSHLNKIRTWPTLTLNNILSHTISAPDGSYSPMPITPHYFCFITFFHIYVNTGNTSHSATKRTLISNLNFGKIKLKINSHVFLTNSSFFQNILDYVTHLINTATDNYCNIKGQNSGYQ